MRNACDDARLSALLDDELDEDEAVIVTRHAAGCEHCTRELDELRSMRQALRSLPPIAAPSPSLFQEAVSVAEHATSRRRRMQVRTGGTAALAAATAAAVWFAGASGDGTVVPPMDRFVADHVGRVDHGPLVTPVDLGR